MGQCGSVRDGWVRGAGCSADPGPPRAAGAIGGEAARRAARGARAHLAGLAAEEAVAGHYGRTGRSIAARRWRGPGGEIDLIAREGDRLVFVEVKRAPTFEAALARVTPRKLARLAAAALDYLVGDPRGLSAEMRLDIALVNGRGEVSVIENAWMA